MWWTGEKEIHTQFTFLWYTCCTIDTVLISMSFQTAICAQLTTPFSRWFGHSCAWNAARARCSLEEVWQTGVEAAVWTLREVGTWWIPCNQDNCRRHPGQGRPHPLWQLFWARVSVLQWILLCIYNHYRLHNVLLCLQYQWYNDNIIVLRIKHNYCA